MPSLIHRVRWLGTAARDLLLRPRYRPQEFWDRRLRNDRLSAVGHRRLDEKENARWYAQLEQDLLAEIEQLGLDLSRQSVLEIGPGTGYWTAVVQRLDCKEYLGIDIAEAAVERLRTKFPDYRFQTGDPSRDSIAGKWDVILMVHVDEHIHGEEFTKALTTIKGTMKPTSNFLASASHPNKKSWVPHVEYHSEEDFTKVFPVKWIHRPVHKFGSDLLLSISETSALHS